MNVRKALPFKLRKQLAERELRQLKDSDFRRQALRLRSVSRKAARTNRAAAKHFAKQATQDKTKLEREITRLSATGYHGTQTYIDAESAKHVAETAITHANALSQSSNTLEKQSIHSKEARQKIRLKWGLKS
jgi:hypothetical protein